MGCAWGGFEDLGAVGAGLRHPAAGELHPHDLVPLLHRWRTAVHTQAQGRHAHRRGQARVRLLRVQVWAAAAEGGGGGGLARTPVCVHGCVRPCLRTPRTSFAGPVVVMVSPGSTCGCGNTHTPPADLNGTKEMGNPVMSTLPAVSSVGATHNQRDDATAASSSYYTPPLSSVAHRPLALRRQLEPGTDERPVHHLRGTRGREHRRTHTRAVHIRARTRTGTRTRTHAHAH